MSLILASQSPRRQELLGLFWIPFTVRVADIDESMDSRANPYAEVARVSQLKALAVPRDPDDVVIAADTIVVCEGRVLGKPHDAEEARQMLRLLSDREIDAYVATGEPMDKAGAYGIQGGAALFCERMVGDYYNVMGLPVCRLSKILHQIAPDMMGGAV